MLAFCLALLGSTDWWGRFLGFIESAFRPTGITKAEKNVVIVSDADKVLK